MDVWCFVPAREKSKQDSSYCALSAGMQSWDVLPSEQPRRRTAWQKSIRRTRFCKGNQKYPKVREDRQCSCWGVLSWDCTYLNSDTHCCECCFCPHFTGDKTEAGKHRGRFQAQESRPWAPARNIFTQLIFAWWLAGLVSLTLEGQWFCLGIHMIDWSCIVGSFPRPSWDLGRKEWCD